MERKPMNRDGVNAEEIYKYTIERENYLKSLSYKVLTQWECTFLRIVKEEKLDDLFDPTATPFNKAHPGSTTQEIILKAIRRGEIFGLALVSLHVPDSWQSQEMIDLDINIKDYWEDYAPIIGNTMVSNSQNFITCAFIFFKI